MIDETNRRPMGKIEVTTRAVATVAAKAVLECYWVVGMASKTLRDGLAVLLQKDNPHRGIEVRFVDRDNIIIDLYVIIEYGMRISEVAHSIMSSVKFSVERSLDLPVVQVNVSVQGVRVSNVD
jgi:uncharacterized alkaline shock family protein YloU